MTTARWRLRTSDVPLAAVTVFHAGLGGIDVKLGGLSLWVESQQHWEDLNAKIMEQFAALPPRHRIPLPRTDNVKPTTDYSSVNCSGACYQSEDE